MKEINGMISNEYIVYKDGNYYKSKYYRENTDFSKTMLAHVGSDILLSSLAKSYRNYKVLFKNKFYISDGSKLFPVQRYQICTDKLEEKFFDMISDEEIGIDIIANLFALEGK